MFVGVGGRGFTCGVICIRQVVSSPAPLVHHCRKMFTWAPRARLRHAMCVCDVSRCAEHSQHNHLDDESAQHWLLPLPHSDADSIVWCLVCCLLFFCAVMLRVLLAGLCQTSPGFKSVPSNCRRCYSVMLYNITCYLHVGLSGGFLQGLLCCALQLIAACACAGLLRGLLYGTYCGVRLWPWALIHHHFCQLNLITHTSVMALHRSWFWHRVVREHRGCLCCSHRVGIFALRFQQCGVHAM